MRVISSTAPMPSTASDTVRMRIVSFTMPCRPSALRLSDRISRSDSVMRRLSRMSSTVPNVIKPSPPTWISSSSVSCPRPVSCVPGSITESPVTHTALVAVNSASRKASGSPVLIAGSVSRYAPSRTSARNPTIITREGEVSAFLSLSRASECGVATDRIADNRLTFFMVCIAPQGLPRTAAGRD